MRKSVLIGVEVNRYPTMGTPYGLYQISAGVTAFSGGASPAPALGANQCP